MYAQDRKAHPDYYTTVARIQRILDINDLPAETRAVQEAKMASLHREHAGIPGYHCLTPSCRALITTSPVRVLALGAIAFLMKQASGQVDADEESAHEQSDEECLDMSADCDSWLSFFPQL